ncbi:MAG: MBL fold metallo-hydrolase [Clostridia bacterium]|nr:MBL fold metallo-hydrolase [Clostridia bacterium]
MDLKKLKKMLLVMGIATCLAMPMAACGGIDDGGDSGNGTNTEQPGDGDTTGGDDITGGDNTTGGDDTEPVGKTQLATPVVTLNGNVASWEAIDGVTYQYSLNNLAAQTAEGNSVALIHNQSIVVWAVGDNETTLDSEKSEPVTYIASALAKPVVTISGSVASWEAMDGVTYKYTVDGGEEVTATENSVALEYDQTLVVWAVGNGETSLDSEKTTVTRKPTQATPTLAELQAGYTFDWDNNYTAITQGTFLATADIENETAKSAIQGANSGFGDYVMRLTGGDRHDMQGLTRGAGNLQVGYVYTVEVDYYAVSASGDYVIALGDADQNITLLSNPFDIGLGKLTFEYEPNSNVQHSLTFWTNGASLDVYLGNIKITAKKAAVARTDYHAVTDEEVLAGYTYDWSENNILSLSNHSKYVALEDIEDATLKTNLENTGAFTSGYALKFAGATGGAYINPLSGKLVEGATYTVSFTAYEVTRGSTTLLTMNSGNAQAGRFDWGLKSNSNGTVTYTTTFKAVSSYQHVSLYVISSCELYISELSLSRTEVEDTSNLTEVQIVGTKAASDCDAYSQGTLVDTPTAAVGKEGFGDKAYKLAPRDNDKTFDLFSATELTVNDEYFQSITITVYYYIEEVTGSGLYLQMGGSNFQALSGNTVGYHKATFTFEYAFSSLCIHYQDGNFGTMYIGSVDYSVTTLRDLSDTSLVERNDYKYLTTAEMTAADGYTYDFSENNALKISANADYRLISGLPGESLKTALGDTGAFTSGYALKLKGASGSSYIQALNYNLIEGYTYTITFDAYQVLAGNICILPMGGQQVGQINFTITKNSNGTHRYTATFTAAEDYLRVNLYILGECELYLANFNVKAVAPTGITAVDIAQDGFMADNAKVELSENGYSASNAIAVTPSSGSAGVWVNAAGLENFEVGDTVRLSFRLNPSGSAWYANVKVYDGNGTLIDYAYPANGWSYVNYDAEVVDKDGVKCVYIGLYNASGEICYISEAQVDDKTTDLDNLFGGTTITQLANVGNAQMEGYLIKTTDGKTVILDGGTTSEATALYNLITANVTANGEGKYVIDAWFISHYHSDHVGALIEILNTRDDIYITTLYYDFSGAQESFDAVEYAHVTGLASALSVNGSKVGAVVTPKKGDEVVVGSVTMKVLNTAYFGSTSNIINNSSIVYKLETDGEEVLFLNDLGDYGDTLLNDEYFASEISTCTVVQMAHHGQAGVSDKFYRAIGDIRVCLYPAPAWLYDVNTGNGIGSGTYGTLGTRELMRALGVRYSYSMANGTITIG